MKGLEFKEEINQRLIGDGIISADKTKMKNIPIFHSLKCTEL